MKLLSLAFLSSLLLGQIGGIHLAPGVIVYVHDILLVVLLVIWGVRRKRVKPKLTKAILAFIAVGLASLLINAGRFPIEQLGTGGLYLVRWVLYAGVYPIVLSEYLKKEQWLYGLFAVGAGFGILGLIQFFLYPDLRNLMYLGWDPHFYRLFSTFFDPNFTGLILLLTIILGFFLWQTKAIRRWIALGLLICMVSFLLTYSRSSFLAAIAAGLAVAVFQKKGKILIAVALFAVTVVLLLQTSGNTLRLLRTDSTLARVGNWQESIALIARAPVFGWGFDTLRYTKDKEGEFISKSDAGMDSSILFVVATTGLVGLVAYGYLVFSMLQAGRGIGVAYYASFIALAVHSLFVNSAFYPWVIIWFWVLTGVAEKKTRHL